MRKAFLRDLGVLFPLLLIVHGCEAPSQGPEAAKAPIGRDIEACNAPPLEWDAETRKKAERVRKFFKKRKRRGRFNGTVLFAEKGRVLHKESYGHRNLRRRDSLKVEDAFQLGSVTKALTATLILRLYEKGNLQLQDSLSSFFDGWPYPGISVEMLLSHRSGLPNYMYFMEEHWKGRYDNEDVLQVMVQDTPNVYYVPDYRYNYCNTNYCLLALIAERATGCSFETLIEREVIEPSNIEELGHPLTMPPGSSLVKGHDKYRRPIRDYRNHVLGDKGLFASVEDLYQFDKALRNGQLLADSTLERAYDPHHRDLYQHDNYGLGWRIDTEDPSDRMVWHNGWWKGFRTYFIRLLERDATIIVLNNTTRGSFLSNRALTRLLFPERKPLTS